MTLVIDPNTPKGQAYVEAIRWSQDQMNEVLKQYFNEKFRIQKGLRLEFNFDLNSILKDKIKVEVLSLEPKKIDEYRKAIEEAKSNLILEDEKKEGEKDVRQG